MKSSAARPANLRVVLTKYFSNLVVFAAVFATTWHALTATFSASCNADWRSDKKCLPLIVREIEICSLVFTETSTEIPPSVGEPVTDKVIELSATLRTLATADTISSKPSSISSAVICANWMVVFTIYFANFTTSAEAASKQDAATRTASLEAWRPSLIAWTKSSPEFITSSTSWVASVCIETSTETPAEPSPASESIIKDTCVLVTTSRAAATISFKPSNEFAKASVVMSANCRVVLTTYCPLTEAEVGAGSSRKIGCGERSCG